MMIEEKSRRDFTPINRGKKMSGREESGTS
jgi:hypothetical protein